MSRTTIIALALIAGLSFLVLPGQAVAQKLEASGIPQATLSAENGATKGRPIQTEDGRERWIVQFADAPLATYAGGIANMAATGPQMTGQAKLNMSSAAVRAYSAYLEGKQEAFVQSLATVAPSASVDFRYDVVFNGVGMAIQPGEIEAIKRMPGVVAVYPDQMRHEIMDASLPLIGAPDLWAIFGGVGNAGAGVKVAIVDSGIRPTNPLFSGTGYTMPTGFPPTDDYCSTTDMSFCTGKIIATRFSSPTFTVDPGEHNSPLGMSGHGTHVAGTAAGNVVLGVDSGDGVLENIAGVAPRAFVMVYKGLFVPLGSTGGSSGSDTMLIAALNHAVADGADVINNSWGGGPGGNPASSPYKPVFDAATAAGVVIVTAAGNDGPGSMTIGCPGCIESTITVAASTTNRMHALPFNITGPGTVPTDLTNLGALQGTGPTLMSDLGPAPIVYAGDIDAANFEGCSAFPASSFSGSIALISRGSCSFFTKVSNAETAGAIGALVFNHTPGAPIIMGFLDAGETISSAMLSKSDGERVRDFVQANTGTMGTLGAAATRVTNDNWQDIVADFSSRGPNGDGGILKPDISAPGVRILSGFSPQQGGDFTFLQGTSMASPHVAGAAALVRQAAPTLPAAAVKTILTGTALGLDVRPPGSLTPSTMRLVKDDGETVADPFDIGAGRMDLSNLLDVGIAFDKPSVADDGCFQSCSATRLLGDLRGTGGTWTAMTYTSDNDLGLTISPSTIPLSPFGTANFTVTANTSLLAPGWYFGKIVWRDTTGTYTDAVMPVAVYAAGSSGTGAVLSKTADLSSAKRGETITFDIDVNNLSLSSPATLTDPIPANSTFVTGSASATISGVPDSSFAYDMGSNSMKWSGTLDLPSISVAAGMPPFGYTSLAGLGASPLPCSSVCDETGLTITGLPSFIYLGQTYDAVVMSSNGYLVPGSSANLGGSWLNQNLPNPTEPNNAIAPFWTDIDMDGTSASDTGAGIWYLGVVTGGPDNFLVFEWEGVEEWGNSGPTFTFQIWIQLGTDNIWFTYGPLGTLPASLTVGAENSDGTIGDTYYYDGTGTAPATGTNLVVTNAGGVGNFTYQVKVGSGIQPIINKVNVTDGTNTVDAAVTVPVDFFELGLNQSSFTTGETLDLSLYFDNPGAPITLDFYLGVILPDGDTVIYFTDTTFTAFGIGSLSDLSTWTPAAAGFDLTAPFLVDATIFSHTFVGLELDGDYTFFLKAVVPGAYGDGTEDPGDALAESVAPLSFNK